MFIRFAGTGNIPPSIGKLINQHADLFEIEFFNAPNSTPIIHEISRNLVDEIELSEQTRIFYFNPETTTWEIGRLLEDFDETLFVKFPNRDGRRIDANEAYVRWSNPIEDPMSYLSEFVSETPYIYEKRSAFVKSVTQQRAIAMGMSALLSSAIELEAHQIEVVRRVLQDPVQRYLLADEVGLGKTIEAGILIRQCMLDCGEDANVLVIVPDSIVKQWIGELTNKFFLDTYIGKQINVVPFSNFAHVQSLIENSTMLVVDEAHLLTDEQSESYRQLYSCINSHASYIERLILMSATPVLHNESGFLKMLHILDPENYQLEDLEGFREKIINRQPMAEISAKLSPEHMYFIDNELIKLQKLFGNDKILQEHVTTLQKILNEFPDEDNQELKEAMNSVKAHISEVYRLHRRILRHRRSNFSGLTPEREGVEVIEYGCSNTKELYNLIERWRFEITTASTDSNELNSLTPVFNKIIKFMGQYICLDSEINKFTEYVEKLGINKQFVSEILDKFQNTDILHSRVSMLVDAIETKLDDSQQFVVFCSAPSTADFVTEQLRKDIAVVVDRHCIEDNSWQDFTSDPTRKILVCDSQAEVGLNLQGGNKTIVHFDLPLNPNQIEQRLGRVDRFGSGNSVQSIALTCRDNLYELNWFEYLNSSLKIFNESVAKLQYLIDNSMQQLEPKLFLEGVEAISDLIAENTGKDGLIQREKDEIDAQDILDSLGIPNSTVSENIELHDGESTQIEKDATEWIENSLIFKRTSVRHLNDDNRIKEPPFHLQYLFGKQQHTLLPLDTFFRNFKNTIDESSEAKRAKQIRTYPLTYKRSIAIGSEGRLNKTHLLRYGEKFIDEIWNITQTDDRGRSCAAIKYIPNYQTQGFADVYFRFDFLVETNLKYVNEKLAEHGLKNNSSKSAVQRRGDMALPPYFLTIWLDTELDQLFDTEIIKNLSAPYQPTADNKGRYDVNISPLIWGNLRKLELPVISGWKSLCKKAKERSFDYLLNTAKFVEDIKNAKQSARVVENNRLSQLKIRIERDSANHNDNELEFESEVSDSLLQGVQKPSVKTDSVCAYFVTGNKQLLNEIRKKP